MYDHRHISYVLPSGVDMGLLQAVAPTIEWNKLKRKVSYEPKFKAKSTIDNVLISLNDESLDSSCYEEGLKLIEHFESNDCLTLSHSITSAAAIVERVFEHLNAIKERAIQEVLFDRLPDFDKQSQVNSKTSKLTSTSKRALSSAKAAAAKAVCSVDKSLSDMSIPTDAMAVFEDGAQVTSNGLEGVAKATSNGLAGVAEATSNGLEGVAKLVHGDEFEHGFEESLNCNAMSQYASDTTLRPIVYALSNGKFINIKASDGSYFHSFENKGYIKHLYDSQAAFSQDEVHDISSKVKSLSSEYSCALQSKKQHGGAALAKQSYQDEVMKIFTEAGYRYMSIKLIAQLYETLCALDSAHRSLHNYVPFEPVNNYEVSAMPLDVEVSPKIRLFVRLLGLYRLCFDYSKDNEWCSIMQDSFTLFRDYAAAQLFNRDAIKEVPHDLAAMQIEHDINRSKENKRFFSSPELLDNDACLLYDYRLHHITNERAIKFENFLAIAAYINARQRFVKHLQTNSCTQKAATPY